MLEYEYTSAVSGPILVLVHPYHIALWDTACFGSILHISGYSVQREDVMHTYWLACNVIVFVFTAAAAAAGSTTSAAAAAGPAAAGSASAGAAAAGSAAAGSAAGGSSSAPRPGPGHAASAAAAAHGNNPNGVIIKHF